MDRVTNFWKGVLNKIEQFATLKKLEIPDFTEGYDELYFVTLTEDNSFEIKKQTHEIQ